MAKSVKTDVMKNENSRGVLRIFFAFTGFLLVLWVLAGGINQVRTGQSIIDFTWEVSQNILHEIQKIASDEGAIEVTEEGVYLRDRPANENP